jgi:hypothetical protein
MQPPQPCCCFRAGRLYLQLRHVQRATDMFATFAIGFAGLIATRV